MKPEEFTARKPFPIRTNVVEASRRESLGQVRSKQEAGEESKQQVIAVTGHSVSVSAASTETQQKLQHNKISLTKNNKNTHPCHKITLIATHSVEQRDVVKHERNNEGSGPQDFTPVWELQF